MLKSSEKLQKLLTVLITWAVLLVCFVAYQQYFVKGQESFFKQRGFRALAKLSSDLTFKFEQAEVSTEAFVKLVASKNDAADDYLDVYLSDVLLDPMAKKNALDAAKQCKSNDLQPEPIPVRFPLGSIQGGDGLSLSIYCFNEISHTAETDFDYSKPRLIYTLNLEPRIRDGFVQQEIDFDDVLVTDSKGHVVLQKSDAGPRITELKSAVPSDDSKSLQKQQFQLSEQPAQHGSAANREGVSQTLPTQGVAMIWSSGEDRKFEKLNDSSFFTDVTLAGESYKMFSQPVQISLPGVKGKPPLKLVIVGLRRSSSFVSETHALPYSTLIWAGLIVAALFSLSWPLFKLRYMSHTERFTPKDGWFLVLTIFLASTSATLILLNASYIQQAKRETDERLKKLATGMKSNFASEMKRVESQLQGLQEIVVKRATSSPITPNYLAQYPYPSHYPYFDIAFWAGCDGIQKLKFDVRKAPTPVVNISNLAFFQTLKEQGGWKFEPSNKTKERLCQTIPKERQQDLIFFQAEKSPNTYEFSALLATPFPADPNSGKHPDFAVQVITLRPMSLINPVLPPGYRFAVINKECKVLFHSDSFRDGNEDFCEESENSNELKPWLFSGTDSSLDISYVGHVERAFLTELPLPGKLSDAAFLIVFQSPDRQVTLNLAVILVCSLLLAAYTAFLLVFAGLHLAFRKPLQLFYAPKFIWPCRQQALTYIQIAVANAVMLLIFWLVYSRLYEVPLLTLALLIPVLSLVFAKFALDGRQNRLVLLALVLFAVGGIGLGTFCLLRSEPLILWCWVFAFLILSAGVAYLISDFAGWPKRLARRFLTRHTENSAQNHFTLLYVLAAISLITSVAVAPALGFFKYAYDAVSELALKDDQVKLSESIKARSDRIQKYYANVQTRSKDDVLRNRMTETLDRNDKPDDAAFTATCEPLLLQPSCAKRTHADNPGFNERIEKMIAGITLLFPANQLGSEMSKLKVAGDFSDGKESWEYFWIENADNPKKFTLVWKPESRLPNFQVTSIYSPWQGLILGAKSCLISLWAILGLWLITVVKKIFFTEFEGVLAHDEVQWKCIGDIKKSALIVGPAKSGKTRWLRTILVPPVDAQARAAGASASSSSTTSGTTVVSSSTGVEWLDMRSNLAQMTCPNHVSVLVLDHFEYNLRDHKVNLERLHLLEDRLYNSDCKVVVVSTVDPLFYLTEGAAEMLADKEDPAAASQLLDRWARVLSKLTRVRLKDLGEEELLEGVVDPFNKHHAKCEKYSPCHQLGQWVEQECRHTAMLQAIGKEILDQFEEGDLVTREWVVRNVLEKADVYYHVLWSGMTASERLVLYQLALDGWANPKNVVALMQLERKSLILRKPMYRILNESFRRFIESTEHTDEIGRWEKNERQSTWRALRLVAAAGAIGTAVWLVYTQAALSQAVAGYVAGIATLLTAVASLFGRSGKTDSPKADAPKEA